MKRPVPNIAAKLTGNEKNVLGSSPASDNVLGKAINPKVTKIRQL